MKIPQQILRIWNKKHSRGDVSRLIHYTQVSKPTIIKAIRHGQANEDTILKISRYYSEKKNHRSTRNYKGSFKNVVR